MPDEFEAAKAAVMGRLEELVTDHGWAVQGVFPTEDDPGPTWSYTIGLKRSYDHPEIVITGLDPRVAQTLLNIMGERIRGGERIKYGERYDKVIENFQVEFLPVRRQNIQRYISDWFRVAHAFYDHDDFEVMQMLWPDAEGRLPGETGFDQNFARIQPLLH